MLSTELAALFARDLRRLQQEIESFPDTDAVWRTVPGVSNAAGTLALHLEGNLREFVGRLLGGIDYTRDRPYEFGARGVAQAELASRVAAAAAVIPPVVAGLSAEVLDAPYPQPIAGETMTARQALIYLIAHFNYHLGQVDYLRRMVTGQGAVELAGL